MKVKVRVIGVGNPLMGDDGIGVRAIEALRASPQQPQVELIDAGCCGLTLLDYVNDCQQLIILDAADFGEPPGTIRTLSSAELPPPVAGCQLSHQARLGEVLLLADKLGNCSPVKLILIQVSSCHPGQQLSAPLTAVLPELVQGIQQEIDSYLIRASSLGREIR